MTGEQRFQGRYCAYCGDRIGVYEPIMVLLADQPGRQTSVLAEGELPAESVAIHLSCYEQRVGGQTRPRADRTAGWAASRSSAVILYAAYLAAAIVVSC
jgi:hypothetical protein